VAGRLGHEIARRASAGLRSCDVTAPPWHSLPAISSPLCLLFGMELPPQPRRHDRRICSRDAVHGARTQSCPHSRGDPGHCGRGRCERHVHLCHGASAPMGVCPARWMCSGNGLRTRRMRARSGEGPNVGRTA
jgi:hypothetical protein